MAIHGVDTDKVFETLVGLIHALRGTSELQESLQRVARAATELIPCEGASVRLLDESREYFVAIARAGEGVHSSPYVKLPANEGIIGWVAQNGEPQLVNDTSESPLFTKRDDQARAVKSILCVPLMARGETTGVVGVTHMDAGAFEPIHIAILELISHCGYSYIEIARLKHLSQTDALTQVVNRRYFYQRLDEEIQRSRRYSHPLTVAMIDLDGFKPVNDTFGHMVGDVVLREVANALREGLRSHDLLGRFGGDEFMVMMPETDLKGSLTAAERLRTSVRERKVATGVKDGHVSVTCSIGLAELRETDTAESLVGRADGALLHAKRQGGDCVV